MSKNKHKIITILLIFIVLILLVNKNLLNASSVSIEVNDKKIEIDLIDPVNYTSDKADFLDVTNKVVLYTPKWHYSTTRNTSNIEYTIEANENQYVINTKNYKGNSLIPLDGCVISIPSSEGIVLNINDIVKINNFHLKKYDRAIENQDGVRALIYNRNTKNIENTVVYYDFYYGNKTNTNYSGSEIVASYDEFKKGFKVINVSKGGNNKIPEKGFVINAQGSEKFNFYENIKFSKNDILKLVNFSYFDLVNKMDFNFNAINELRKTDYMVIYTPNSSMTTGQNQYGVEVAVDKNGYIFWTSKLY